MQRQTLFGVVTFVCCLALFFTGCSDNDSRSYPASVSGTTSSASQATSAQGGGTVHTPQLQAARGNHTATKLPSGGVLVAGGLDSSGNALNSAEVYSSRQFVSVGTMRSARVHHDAVQLPNGDVWITGGTDGQTALTSTEIYRSASQQFLPGPALQAPRAWHRTVTYTQGGETFILVVGGANTQQSGIQVQTAVHSNAELYKLQAGQVTFVANVPQAEPTAGPAVTRLANGKILVAGGIKAFGSRPVAAGGQEYDPANRAFVATNAMAENRYHTAATTLSNGQGIVIGGNNQAGPTATAEIYSSSSRDFQRTSQTLVDARESLTASRLPSGVVLVAGGKATQASARVEQFTGNGFALMNPLLQARSEHTATVLPSGNILFIGGFDANNQALRMAEEYSVNVQGPTAGPSTGQPGGIGLPGTPGGNQPGGNNGGNNGSGQALPPTLVYITPDHAPVGSAVTLFGTNFASPAKSNIVTFNGVRAPIVGGISVKNIPIFGKVSSMVVEVPQGATTGQLTIESNGMVSNPKPFTVDSNQARPAPKLHLVLPKRGKEGSFVTIFGRNFDKSASNNIVRFNGVQAKVIGGLSTRSLPLIGNVAAMLTRVPKGATTGPLTVEAYGKVSNGKTYTVKGTTSSGNTGGSTGGSTGGTTGGNTGGSTGGTTGGSTGGTTGGTVIFADDFEGSTQMQQNQGGIWELDDPSRYQRGPARAAKGTGVAGTRLNGDYDANANSYLYASVDLRNRQSATLLFKHWYAIQSGVDGARVLATTDGKTFYRLDPQAGYSGTSAVFNGPGFSGQSGGWVEDIFDLSSFAGQQVTLVFQFASDASGSDDGWFIDDVRVVGSGSGSATSGSGSTSSGSTGGSTSTGGNTGTSSGSTSQSLVLADRFEGSTVLQQNQGGIWELDDPSRYQVGPAQAGEGQMCVGTRLSGDYDSNVNTYLIGSVDLTGKTNATLSFKHWYRTEAGVDGARVLATLDGKTFYRLDPAGGYSMANVAVFGDKGFSGTSNGWETESMDLSFFAGSKVSIVFQFVSDGQNTDAGWYLDDLKVSAK